MKQYTEEQLAKLPKWAQSYIESLRRENRELNESIQQASNVVNIVVVQKPHELGADK